MSVATVHTYLIGRRAVVWSLGTFCPNSLKKKSYNLLSVQLQLIDAGPRCLYLEFGFLSDCAAVLSTLGSVVAFVEQTVGLLV